MIVSTWHVKLAAVQNPSVGSQQYVRTRVYAQLVLSFSRAIIESETMRFGRALEHGLWWPTAHNYVL